MSTLVRSIGRCYVNGVGFDVYENENGSATIRPVKLGHDLPKRFWKTFDSVEDAEDFIDSYDSDQLTGAGLVQNLKETAFSHAFS